MFILCTCYFLKINTMEIQFKIWNIVMLTSNPLLENKTKQNETC